MGSGVDVFFDELAEMEAGAVMNWHMRHLRYAHGRDDFEEICEHATIQGPGAMLNHFSELLQHCVFVCWFCLTPKGMQKQVCKPTDQTNRQAGRQAGKQRYLEMCVMVCVWLERCVSFLTHDPLDRPPVLS